MTPPRLGSVVLAVAAVVVSQVGRTVGEFAPELVVFVVVAGAAIAFQSAFNGRIALATRDPVAATAVNVVVGTVALVTIVTVVAASGQLEPLQWPGEPWLYAGGALGVTVVLTLAIASAALGVLRATIAVLAAQMITAFAVDWVIDNEGPTAGAIAGAVLIVAAVALVGRTSGPPAAPARREDPHDVTSA